MSDFSTNWGNNPQNFVATWVLENPGHFVVSEDPQSSDLLLEVCRCRGLVDSVYQATYQSESISVVFELVAAGLVGDQRKMTYACPLVGAAQMSATADNLQARNSSDWGSTIESFDGTWSFADGGEMVIMNKGQIQCVGVAGLKDGVYQGVLASAKHLHISFGLVDNGHVDGDPNKPREVQYVFPEINLIGSPINVPTEIEVYEAESGGGG